MPQRSPYSRSDALKTRHKELDTGVAQRHASIDQHLAFANEILQAERLTTGEGSRLRMRAWRFRRGPASDGVRCHGVDVLEYWGKDHHLYWLTADKPPPEVVARLHTVDLNSYRLPFADHTFDFCFSDQVFEHVFDYVTVFRELARVLKPGALSVHRFPGPNRLMEGHVNLPFPWLCSNRSYLKIMAMMQHRPFTGTDWRNKLASNLEIMKFNNYPTKSSLGSLRRRPALASHSWSAPSSSFAVAVVSGRFLDFRRQLGLSRPSIGLAGFFMQRYMVLRAR